MTIFSDGTSKLIFNSNESETIDEIDEDVDVDTYSKYCMGKHTEDNMFFHTLLI